MFKSRILKEEKKFASHQKAVKFKEEYPKSNYIRIVLEYSFDVKNPWCVKIWERV